MEKAKRDEGTARLWNQLEKSHGELQAQIDWADWFESDNVQLMVSLEEATKALDTCRVKAKVEISVSHLFSDSLGGGDKRREFKPQWPWPDPFTNWMKSWTPSTAILKARQHQGSVLRYFCVQHLAHQPWETTTKEIFLSSCCFCMSFNIRIWILIPPKGAGTCRNRHSQDNKREVHLLDTIAVALITSQEFSERFGKG